MVSDSGSVPEKVKRGRVEEAASLLNGLLSVGASGELFVVADGYVVYANNCVPSDFTILKQ